MALVSIDNITLPFRNKWHLVTICVIAGLFGVWRASGGGFEVAVPEESISSQPAVTRRAPAQSKPKPQPAKRTNDLDSLIKTQPKKTSPAKKQNNRSSFDDIEKSLGLR